MIGAGVALAVYLADRSGSQAERSFRVGTAAVFWPLYIPVLLRGTPTPPTEAMPADDVSAAITQVDCELQAALGSLRGWAEGVLVREKDRLTELRSAWSAQAERIREMDRLLQLPEHAIGSTSEEASPRMQQSEQARLRNLHCLQQLRERAHDDLLGSLAAVRELVSMIHLAKFTGAPAARAEEIVAQIAAAVEGLSIVTAQEPPFLDGPAPSCATAANGLHRQIVR
ncbi:MAG TPA: hypothetical protein VFE62_29370 [Gemmataceae bacterium]|nr:hypothetical protein [Gemmataceae bacterium]